VPMVKFACQPKTASVRLSTESHTLMVKRLLACPINAEAVTAWITTYTVLDFHATKAVLYHQSQHASVSTVLPLNTVDLHSNQLS